MKVFIDSNIPMYTAGGEHPNQEPSRRFLARVGGGEIDACTSAEVLQEILYRYSSLGRVDLAGTVYDLFLEICPAVLDVTLADTDRARDLLLALGGLSARNSLHAGLMLNHRIEWVATFDRGFDAVEGIRRFELD